MTLSKFVLLLLEAILNLLVSSCKVYQNGSNVDADGIPIDEEWEKQTFLLPILRDTIAQIKYGFSKKDCHE